MVFKMDFLCFIAMESCSLRPVRVVDKVKEGNVTPDTIASVSSMFDGEIQYTNVFRVLETTYHQNSFIKDHFRFVVSLIHAVKCYMYYSIPMCLSSFSM